jgi:hypothetical protein
LSRPRSFEHLKGEIKRWNCEVAMWALEIRLGLRSWSCWTALRKEEGFRRRRRGEEGWLQIWKPLFDKRKLAEGRNQGCGGKRREISVLNSSTRWLMLIGETILLSLCL